MLIVEFTSVNEHIKIYKQGKVCIFRSFVMFENIYKR